VDEVQWVGLAELLDRIDGTGDDLVIYVEEGALVTLSSRVALVSEDDVPPEGMAYFLEVPLVKDVLRVWSDWRGGLRPGGEEACSAIVFYAVNDAFQPRG
jgi:hypothetical protein